MNGFEKFPPHELKTLHDELKQSGLDSFQIAELLAAFLVQHGYGVSTDQARTAASSMEVVALHAAAAAGRAGKTGDGDVASLVLLSA